MSQLRQGVLNGARRRQVMHAVTLGLTSTVLAVSTSQSTLAAADGAEASLEVCVRRDSADLTDFQANFANGPIHLPAGVVFDYAGHAFGPVSDPIDGMHDKRGGGWTGITPAEQKRREDLMFEDAGSDHRRPEGLVTLSEAVVTKAHSCASIPVAALLSQEWRWSVAPVFGSSDVYFQAYGVLAGGLLNTEWTQQPPSLKDAGISGSLNGVLHGTTTRAISID